MAAKKWNLSGDYFENCNCNVVCPCLVSPSAPLTARPSQGVCDVALVFHIDKGSYEKVSLDGLNVAVVGHTPGAMGEGNWTIAAYIDERADEQQTEALGAIFSGAEGGPMAAFAPLIGNHLGVKKVAIKYAISVKAVRRKFPVSCRWQWSPCRRCIVAVRFGRQPAIRSHRTSSRSPAAPRAAPSPTTECAGTIPARTAITRRSAGRIDVLHAPLAGSAPGRQFGCVTETLP